MEPHNQFMHDKINAMVDGQLPADQRAEVQAGLAEDSAAQEMLDAWTKQRSALRELHRPLLQEPIPQTLLAAARQSQQSHQQLNQWWRWGGMAASVVVAFGMGWLANTLWGTQAATMASGRPAAAQAFIRQASLAHAVFSPEIRHPVEVMATEQDHLVAWLSKRLGKPLKVPNLKAQGYDLVGGRLLPGDAPAPGARAQFMFQNTAGTRITLYLGLVDANPATNAVMGRETAFRFGTEGPVPSFYWVDQGFGYALSGPVSREALLKLAETVYSQL